MLSFSANQSSSLIYSEIEGDMMQTDPGFISLNRLSGITSPQLSKLPANHNHYKPVSV